MVRKLDRIHLDLVGPFLTRSANGQYEYFQTMIDAGTRVSCVSLLKRKSEALVQTQALITALEVDSGQKVKVVRTDGGGEYSNAHYRRRSSLRLSQG